MLHPAYRRTQRRDPQVGSHDEVMLHHKAVFRSADESLDHLGGDDALLTIGTRMVRR